MPSRASPARRWARWCRWRTPRCRKEQRVNTARYSGKALLVAVLALGGGAPRLTAQARPPTLPPALRTTIQRMVDSAQVPSVTVAVARNGAVLWEDAFGYADIEHQVAATPYTLYSLASISKPFTATAVMRLVEQGRVRLDEPVNSYLGSMRLTGM